MPGSKLFRLTVCLVLKCMMRARLRYAWAGDEFGYLLPDENDIKLRVGDRVRFIPPHCDPTVNLYDLIYICEGDQVVDTWPVMERTPSSPSLRHTR